MPEPETTSTTIQTVDQDGKAPKNRIPSAQAAWGAFDSARMESAKNDARFASIRGQYDGFPPVDPAELDRQGLADAPNINMRQCEAKVDSYASTWVDINTGGDEWAEVKVKPKHCSSAEECLDKSERLTQFYNEAIREWEDNEEEAGNGAHYILESSIRDAQMGLFGLGIPHFTDHIDWRWSAIPTRKVHVPQGTRITLSNAPAMFVEKSYPVTQLYDYVQDEETAKRNKWNREAVLRVIYSRTEGGSDREFARFSEWENKVRNNATILEQNFTPIELVHAYVQEFTVNRAKNGVSHYIVAQGESEYLFEYDRQFAGFRQIIVPFCDKSGPEGDWHGIKGFGDKVYDACHFNNLMFNSIALGAILQTLPFFESDGEADREKLSQVVFSRLGILFPGLKLSQVRLNADLNGSMAVLGESNRVLNSNTRIFPSNDAGPRGDTPTATQVTFDRQDEAAFTNSQVRFYRMTGADPLLREMYRRLSQSSDKYPEAWPGGKVAKRFREKCKEAGITDEQRMDVQYVRASRSGGSGNQALDAMKAEKVLGVATPGRGQMNARKELVKAHYGPDMVSAFIEDAPPATPEMAWVMMENATFQNGQFVPAFPFQPVEVHLGFGQNGELGKMGHLGVLADTQEAATQLQDAGVETALPDAIKLNKVIAVLIDHIGMHVEHMSKLAFYEPVVKQLSKLLNDASQFNENLASDITLAMEQQQAENPQMDPETQRLYAKTQAEIETQRMKTAAEIQNREVQTIAKIQNQQATAESRHAIKEAEALANIGLKTEQELIDQQRQRVDIAIKASAAAKTRAKGNVDKTKS